MKTNKSAERAMALARLKEQIAAQSDPVIAVVAVSKKSLAQTVQEALNRTGVPSLKIEPSHKLFGILNPTRLTGSLPSDALKIHRRPNR